MQTYLRTAAAIVAVIVSSDCATYAQNGERDYGKSITGPAARERPAKPTARGRMSGPEPDSPHSRNPSAGSKEESPGLDSATSNSH
jgi:hypothetical protein